MTPAYSIGTPVGERRWPAYAFVFNLAYDRAFPLPGWGEVAAEPSR
jgi:hypothetical protein